MAKPKLDKDRPAPVVGEMNIDDETAVTLHVPSGNKATSAVLDAYASDARAAISAYESQIQGEDDPRRIGRLQYEIGRLYETVIGDLEAAGTHLDRALMATPDHLPVVVAARRVRLRLEQFEAALDLFDHEIRASSDRGRSAALWFAKARVLEDDLQRPADARAAYRCAADLSDGDAVRLKALEEADLGRKAYGDLSKVYAETATVLRGDARHRAIVLKLRARVEEVYANNLDGATELYAEALDAHPDVPSTLDSLVRLHEGAGRWRDLVHVLARKAALATSKRERATILHRIGRVQATRLLNLDDAIGALQAARRAYPDPVILDALAALHEEAADYGAQAEVLSQLAELTTADSERLLHLQRIGEICHDRLEDDDTAIAALEAALAIDPAHVPVLRILAPIYYKSEAWPQLIGLHKAEAEATTDTRRRAVAHARTAEIYERIGEEPPAIEHLERALELDPENTGSFASLVRLYRRAQAWRKLIELYERFLDSVGTERRIAYLFEIAALSAERLEEPERAEGALQRILSLRPDHLGAVHTLQRVSEDARRYAQLVAAIEREVAMIKDPAQIVGLLHRAGEVLHERLDEPAKALATFKRVLKIDDKHLPTLAHLGRMYHGQRRWTDLVETFELELKATERGGRTLILLQRMGEVYLRELAQPDLAAKCFQRALDVDARYAPAVRGLTEILSRKSAWPAIAALRERELTETQDPAARSVAAMRTGALYEERLDDLPGAERCFVQALGQDPSNHTAREAVLRVRIKLKRWGQLATERNDEAERAEGVDDKVVALMRAAELWSDQAQDLRKAVAAYVAVLGLSPGHLGALVALEPLYRQARAWKQLAELYSRQFEAFRDPAAQVAALTERVRILEREKVGSIDDIIDCYTSILSLRPKDSGALTGLERFALIGQDPQVLAAVDSRLAGEAKDPELKAAYLTRRAESLEVAGNPEALDVYREVLSLDAENRGALRGLARLAEVLGHDDALAEAARAETKIARNAQEEADAWTKSGRIHMDRIGDRNAAAEDLERALTCWPDHEGAAAGLIQLLTATTDFVRLVECLMRAAAQAKDPARVAALWMEVARVYTDDVRDPSGAIDALGKLLKIQPNNADGMIRLAELYLADRRVHETIEIVGGALKLRLDDTQRHRAHVLLATAHESEGETESAFLHFGHALDLDPNDAETLHRVAELQVRKGLHAAAVDTTQRLLGLVEDEAEQADALVFLARSQIALDRREDAVDTLAEAVALQGATGAAAGELARQATAPHHWQRYVSALGDYKDERTLKGRSLVAQYLEIARVQHDRLQSSDAALSTIIEGMRATEGADALRFVLSQRLCDAGRQAEALEQLELVIGKDVARVDAWRLLLKAYGELGLAREQEITLGGLAVLGDADTAELERVRAWRPFTRGIPAGAVDVERCPELVVAREQQQPAVNLMSAICDGLGKVRPPDLGAWGVSSRDKISPKSDHSLRTLVERLAAITGVTEYELYVHRHRDRGVGIENTTRPSILMPLWIGEVSASQQVFLLTEALVHLARGTYPLRLFTTRDLEVVLTAATRSAVPGFGDGLAPAEVLDDKQKLVQRGIPRRKRKQVEVAAAEYARAPQIDVASVVGWIEQTGRRVAMLVADDLLSSLEVLRRTEKLGNARGLDFVRTSPMVADLMKVWIAGTTMQTRRDIHLVPPKNPS